MPYHVNRNGQTYGPYTLDDLRRYLASGNVLPTDLCKSEEMAEWTTVAQVTSAAPTAPSEAYAAQPTPYAPGTYASGTYAPGAYDPSAYAAGAQPLAPAAVYPDPPTLAWGLVLLFAALTCGLFMAVWNVVLSAWMKRVEPASTAMFYYIAAIVLLFLQIVFGNHAAHTFTTHSNYGWMISRYSSHPGNGLLWLVTWVVRLVARFSMRADLERHFNGPEPIGLTLSGVMTFFFGGLYFQYHLNRINELKRVARYRGAIV